MGSGVAVGEGIGVNVGVRVAVGVMVPVAENVGVNRAAVAVWDCAGLRQLASSNVNNATIQRGHGSWDMG